ncbi:Lrp/AsnC ligand binding domain-containing protein [Terasakiella sp. A23]|uniref:Lrp/AsnC family transcriptional regulator n=1 Tax=Terasakiella sp. FCG-A23 TaxID=3080561 RepID=UPI0029545768|nr:Lrp/AsnC ligand binding domain-containing protein [Terasakiella sp. A23]MDV7339474.1 Lrp/AsnC ligand binding domain-containing protein [Terasakiella sp. A23]
MVKSIECSELDAYDIKILTHLAKEGRLTITELANRVGLSKSPCQVRLKRLIEEGYIMGFQAMLNPAKLGLEHIAFTTVKLSNTTEKGLTAFNEAVVKVPEIELCHMIAGSFDYLLKVRTSDIQAYRRVLGEEISTLPHVASTSTFVVMEAIKDTFN